MPPTALAEEDARAAEAAKKVAEEEQRKAYVRRTITYALWPTGILHSLLLITAPFDMEVCMHDCSKYCLDEMSWESRCACLSCKLETHHTDAAEESPEPRERLPET